MKVEITVDGITRTFQGSYDELHNRDWNERVRDMLDTVEEATADRMNEFLFDAKAQMI